MVGYIVPNNNTTNIPGFLWQGFITSGCQMDTNHNFYPGSGTRLETSGPSIYGIISNRDYNVMYNVMSGESEVDWPRARGGWSRRDILTGSTNQLLYASRVSVVKISLSSWNTPLYRGLGRWQPSFFLIFLMCKLWTPPRLIFTTLLAGWPSGDLCMEIGRPDHPRTVWRSSSPLNGPI